MNEPETPERILVLPPDGPPLIGEAGALDLIGELYDQDVRWVAVPLARLGPDFLRLETRQAGLMIQKLTNYGIHLAVVGDIAAEVEHSRSLRDFVREANRGRTTCFVPDLAGLQARFRLLSPPGGSNT